MSGVLDFLIAFFMWFISLFATLFLHEAGHAAMYRILTGDDGWKIILGFQNGKTLFQIKKIIVKSGFFLMLGYCSVSNLPTKKSHQILFYLGGIFVNIFIAVLLIMLVFLDYVYVISIGYTWANFINILFTANLITLILSVLPVKYLYANNLPSDMLQVIWSLKNKKPE